MNEPNKKLTLVVRLILLVWGLILGWWFAGFILGLYPEYFNPAVGIVIRTVNAIVFGVILATLAKPVSVFTMFVGRKLRSAFTEKPLYVTGSVALGLVIGAMAGVLANAIVELFTAVFAAKFIIDLTAAAVFAYIGYLICKKWLSTNVSTEENVIIEYSGYIVSYGAFFSERVVYVTELINGKIYILDSTVRKLIELSNCDESAKTALNNYLKLSEYASVRIVNTQPDSDETENLLNLAENKLLKIIVGDGSEIKTERNVKVLSLADL